MVVAPGLPFDRFYAAMVVAPGLPFDRFDRVPPDHFYLVPRAAEIGMRSEMLSMLLQPTPKTPRFLCTAQLLLSTG
jgi:hypothetical protein